MSSDGRRSSSLRVKVCNTAGKVTLIENFGFEESFRHRWDCALKLLEFQQTVKIKYQISPLFTRRRITPPPPSINISNNLYPQLPHQHHHQMYDDHLNEATDRDQLLYETRNNTHLHVPPAATAPSSLHGSAEFSNAIFPPPPSPKTLDRVMRVKR